LAKKPLFSASNTLRGPVARNLSMWPRRSFSLTNCSTTAPKLPQFADRSYPDPASSPLMSTDCLTLLAQTSFKPFPAHFQEHHPHRHPIPITFCCQPGCHEFSVVYSRRSFWMATVPKNVLNREWIEVVFQVRRANHQSACVGDIDFAESVNMYLG